MWLSVLIPYSEIPTLQELAYHSSAGVRIWRVRFRDYKPPLIHTKRGAITVSVLTGFLFAMSIRALFLYARHGGQPQFQLPFTSEVLPSWAIVAVNLALYAYLLWLGVVFYRIARNGERVVVAGWAADFLLGPTKIIFSPAGALAIRYVQTAAMATAFMATLFLLRKPYSAPQECETRALKRGLFVMGAVIGTLLLVGMLLYFIPLR
jgi:hypothetical protein